VFLNIKLHNKPRRALCYLFFLTYIDFNTYFYFDKLKISNGYFLKKKITLFCQRKFFYKFVTVKKSII
jgi:hypothetical protein